MTDKAKRALSIVVYILFALAAGLYATVYLCAEFNVDWALNLKLYLEQRWNVVLGGGTFAALFSLFRFFKVIKAKNDFSLDEVKRIGGNISGIESQLRDTIREQREQMAAMSAAITEIKGIKETVGGFNGQLDIITDLLLLQTEKTSSDQTMAQIRVAYREGNFLKQLEQLKAIDKEPDEEIKQIESSAKATIKELIRKETASIKRRI